MLLAGAALISGQKRTPAFFGIENSSYMGKDRGIPRFDDANAYIRSFTSNPWINGAIKARADATAVARLVFGREFTRRNPVSGDPEQVFVPAKSRAGSIIEVFDNPNPYMDAFALWEWVTSFLLLDGNAYLVYEEQFRELWPMIPSRVTIVPDKKNFIAGYTYEVQGQKIFYKPEQVIHFKRYSPISSHYGMSDLQALAFDINLDAKTRRYLNAFFERGARLSGVVEVENDIDPDSLKRVQKQFQQDHGGVEGMHKVAFLESGMKWQKTGQTNAELQIGELSQLSRESVMAVYRTPPALVGIWAQARFSNAREQIRTFFENVQVAFWKKLAATVSRHPLVRNQKLSCRFDYSDLPAFRESANEQAERGRILIQSGQWTINEVRSKLWNLPPREEGDMLVLPKSAQNTDLGQNDPKQDDKKSNSDAKKTDPNQEDPEDAADEQDPNEEPEPQQKPAAKKGPVRFLDIDYEINVLESTLEDLGGLSESEKDHFNFLRGNLGIQRQISARNGTSPRFHEWDDRGGKEEG